MSDDLDKAVARRFTELDHLDVPDTWSRALASSTTVRPGSPAPPHRRALLVAAVAVLVVAAGAALVWSRGSRVETVSSLTAASGNPVTTTTVARASTTTRVDLPATTAAVAAEDIEMMSSWPAPPNVTPALAAVPRLWPTAAIPGAKDVERLEHADDPATFHGYSQLWFGDGKPTPILTIRTNVAQHPDPRAADVPVDVGLWDNSFFVRTGDGVTDLSMDDPSGSVTIWASGLAQDQVLAIARSLTPRSEGMPGWDVGTLDPSLLPLHEGWGMGAASRSVSWSNGSLVAEMWIVSGVPEAITTPWSPGSTVAITDVGGTRAVTYEIRDRVATVWSSAPDVVVVLGLHGTLEDALTIARSVEKVDQARWEASSRPDVSTNDGCTSMFC